MTPVTLNDQSPALSGRLAGDPAVCHGSAASVEQPSGRYYISSLRPEGATESVEIPTRDKFLAEIRGLGRFSPSVHLCGLGQI